MSGKEGMMLKLDKNGKDQVIKIKSAPKREALPLVRIWKVKEVESKQQYTLYLEN